MTPKERADRAGAVMWGRDNASKWAGMELVDINEGTATLTLNVQDHHCNGHGICHGGVTFMLADSAFAFACNSRNQSTVAQHNVVSYLAPARAGDRLTAQATELSLTGRSGIYDVTVTNQDHRKIAEFRGFSRAIGGAVFDET
ncbi:hydroxyphenylacetyl-CoA thioesterase PaaI [Ruegeria sp.]|uniref:hydroxyphenylacetyl-CoA thioesterase PaaI n=1 Tax=Ruegeria sp. TaxID=1879320 RepID=UPI003C7D33B3